MSRVSILLRHRRDSENPFIARIGIPTLTGRRTIKHLLERTTMQLRDFVEGEGYAYREMAVAAGYQLKPGGNFERGIALAPKDMPSAIMIKMNLAKGLHDDSFRAEGIIEPLTFVR